MNGVCYPHSYECAHDSYKFLHTTENVYRIHVAVNMVFHFMTGYVLWY